MSWVISDPSEGDAAGRGLGEMGGGCLRVRQSFQERLISLRLGRLEEREGGRKETNL